MIENKIDYIIDKYLKYYEIIDYTVQNIFNKGVLSVVLKYMYRFNLCSIRDRVINKVKTDIACSRCSTVETWKYIIQCSYIRDVKDIFIIDIESKLKKASKSNTNSDKIDLIMNNTKKYLKN